MATTFRINPYFEDKYAGESDLIVVAPLALVSSTPTDAASDVAVGTAIILEFNEEPASVGTVTLQVSGGATVETFDLSAPGLITGTTVTLDPAADLSPDTSYDVAIGTDLTNLAGTAFAGDTISFSVPAADTTAPVLSSPSATATGETTVDFSFTTDEGNGTLYRGAWADGATPSAADVQAGTGAVVHGSQAVTATGAQMGSLTGLTERTAYEVFAVQEDAAGNLSAAVRAGVATDSAGSIEPTLIATETTSAETNPYRMSAFESPGSDGLVIVVGTYGASSKGDTMTLTLRDEDGATTVMDIDHVENSSYRNVAIFHHPNPPTGMLIPSIEIGGNGRACAMVLINMAGYTVAGDLAHGSNSYGTSIEWDNSTIEQSLSGSIAIYALARSVSTGEFGSWSKATSLASLATGGNTYSDVRLDVAWRALSGNAVNDTPSATWSASGLNATIGQEFGSSA